MYQVTKTYGHDIGLSCVFRQHRASSHCRYLHGYALSFAITFEAATLDENGWVIDFGSLRWLKEWLQRQFDHTMLIAADDPEHDLLANLGDLSRLCIPRVVDAVGCEAFARQTFNFIESYFRHYKWTRVRVVSVKVSEHGANSATFPGIKFYDVGV